MNQRMRKVQVKVVEMAILYMYASSKWESRLQARALAPLYPDERPTYVCLGR